MTEEVQSTLGVSVLKNGLPIGNMDEPKYPGATATVKETRAQNNIGGIMTKLVAWIDHDVLGFKVKQDGSAAQATLQADIYDRDMDTWTVVMPPDFHGGGHSFSWVGQISKCTPTEDDGVAYLDMEVTVNGRITPCTTWATGLTTTFFGIVDDDSNALTPSPAASATVYEYDLEAYSDNTSIAITPVFTAGTCYINGTSVATTVSSGAITINTGSGAVTYVPIVVTEINKTPKIYWIRVHVGLTAHP
jgi:hypothetical protein